MLYIRLPKMHTLVTSSVFVFAGGGGGETAANGHDFARFADIL